MRVDRIVMLTGDNRTTAEAVARHLGIAEIEAEVNRCLATVGNRSGYILSTSCEIPPMSKPEIVQWFMDAAREYGRYERIIEVAEAPAGG